MKLTTALLLMALVVTSCDGGDTGADRSEPRGSAAIHSTSSDTGRDGLHLDLIAPRSVSAGDTFEAGVVARDNAGANRGIEVDFGDGYVWGGLPFDLVCGAEAGETPTEGPSEKREEITHSYARSGIYEIVARTYTGGCFVKNEDATVRAKIEVVGEASSSNGPEPPRAKIGHAYYVDGDPSILVSDIGGYDQDGFVSRIEVDWGDGSPIETLTRPLSRCNDKRGWPSGWFSESLDHAYEEDGSYEVLVEVVSVGCNGRDPQRESATRTLEHPPEQGS